MFDLETAISNHTARERAQAEAKARADAVRAREEKALEMAAFLRQIDAVLPAELRTSLNARVVDDHAGWGTPAIILTIDGEPWTLDINNGWLRIHEPRIGEHWSLRSGDATEWLLAAIVRRREQRARWDAERAREDTEQAAAQADATTCRERIAAAVAEARETLWRWPADTALALYHWRWATAPAGPDGVADYDDAWSAQPTLDGGWLTTLSGREVFLPYTCPVAERRVVRSLEELPTNLRRPVRITITDIYRDRDGCRTSPGSVVYEDIGEEPIDAVRALVWRARQEATRALADDLGLTVPGGAS